MFIVGIDIAKKNHQALITDSNGKPMGKSFRFQNSLEGFRLLLSKMNEISADVSQFEIGMEATGHYWINLYTRLVDCKYVVHVINPLQSDALRNLYIRRTKTDSVDCKIIAQVIRIGQYAETRLKDDKLLAVRDLSRQRFYMVDICADLKRKVVVIMDKIFPEYQHFFSDMFGKTSCAILKRCASARAVAEVPLEELSSIMSNASRGKFKEGKARLLKLLAENSFHAIMESENLSLMVVQMIEQIELYERQIKVLEGCISEFFSSYDSSLTELPGIGPVLGAVILSEIGDINRFSSAKKLAAFAGIDPSVKQSGNFISHENHMSKRGSPYLRRALWIASFVNVNHNKDILKVYGERCSQGKNHFKTMGFLCHKLLNQIYFVLKNESHH